jgi:carboxypeptidase Q
MQAMASGCLLAVVAASCAPPSTIPAAPSSWAAVTTTPAATAAVAESAALAQTQYKIVEAARHDHSAYQKLAQLTDTIGNRLSGTAALTRALQWAVDTMKADGHENVHVEKVMVQHWVRGNESASVTSSESMSLARPLHIVGLGGTVAGDVTAPLVVVSSWEELEKRKADVVGAIVLLDVAMPAWTEQNGAGYGNVVQYRVGGPIAVAKLGGVGVLMRSVTARSLSTPHTGATRYAPDVVKIPAAAVTVEDSQWLHRATAAGQKLTVHLQLASQQLPDVESGNVIAELRGRELPDEIIVIGAHIDSWDVGQGAHDDGAGCVIMMQALTTLRQLGLIPRRTIRVVLFTNEENGIRGAKQYAIDHASEIANHVAALESDSGGFAPLGFLLELAENTPLATQQRVQQRARQFVVGAGKISLGHSGTDVGPLVEAGVPGFGLDVDNRTYFDIHHTNADTLDKVNADELAADVAAVASFVYGLADSRERLLPAAAPKAK